jgi:type VI secretion system protein VasJ
VSSVAFDEKLVAPLPGDGGVGRDLTYEPQFQELQTEVELATSLSGKSVDWPRVKDVSERLLRDESKDLRLASWWFVAGAHVDGWDGLSRGLGLYGALIDQHWDGMFPPAKRAKARAGLAEWMWESTRKALAPRDLTSAQVAGVRASLAALGELDRNLAERLGDLNPGIGPLRSLLREKAESVAEPPPPVVLAAPPPVAPPLAAVAPPAVAAVAPVQREPGPSATAPSATAPPVFDAAPEAPTGSVSSEQLQQVTSTWRERLFAVARAAREADPSAAASYRLARVAAWLSVEAAPDVEKGKTFVRASRADEARDLRAMFESGNWSLVVSTAESTLLEHLYWLDLNFFSYAALDRLGPVYAGARAMVLHETLSFLDRVPGLESLAFRDGSPFASADTLAWLRVKRGRGAAASALGAGTPLDEAAGALLDAARTGCGDGRVADALAEGLVAAGALPSARGRFRARLELAKLALGEGRKDVGVCVLEALLGEVDASLEAWEPALCAEALTAFLEASSFRADTGADERQRLLFRRLLKLDPASAMRIGS